MDFVFAKTELPKTHSHMRASLSLRKCDARVHTVFFNCSRIVMMWKQVRCESPQIKNLQLPQSLCDSLHDVSLLGQGMGRGVWEVKQSAAFDVFQGAPIVRKARSFHTHQSPRTVSMANIKEALIMNTLRVQNGPNASVRMYGLCCRGTANSSGVNLIMEKLYPIPLNDTRSHKERFASFFKRMTAFPLGPLEIPDFKFSSIAMSANHNVHAIDLPCVHIGDQGNASRLQVYNYMMECWDKNEVDCFQKLAPVSRKSWSNMKVIGLSDKQFSFLINPMQTDRQKIRH